MVKSYATAIALAGGFFIYLTAIFSSTREFGMLLAFAGALFPNLSVAPALMPWAGSQSRSAVADAAPAHHSRSLTRCSGRPSSSTWQADVQSRSSLVV